MTVIVRSAHPDHYAWIARRTRLNIGPGFHALEAVRGDKIIGMVGFDGWTATSVAMHVAVDEPHVIRRLLRPSFGLAFYEYGKEVVIAQVLGTNVRSLRLVKGLGFREVFRGTDWVDHGVDMVLLEMRRGECRWLEA